MRAGVGSVLNRVVIISALGYFVDIYDLILFAIVRVPSLTGLGFEGDAVRNVGAMLLSVQMGGMLVGGILWGVLGDKRGRLSVLFGSILLYSLANIANAFVAEIAAATGGNVVATYAILRFVAGVGLAGELGAAITLVSEVLPKETRGYGTAIVASVGILGAVVGGFVGRLFTWQMAYIIGGLMGLALLVARVTMIESGMYQQARKKAARHGDLLFLFSSRARVAKYAWTVLIGLPLWFAIGILVAFSPEISRELGVTGTIVAGTAIMFAYGGLAVGDLASGFLSQYWGSRKNVVVLFLTMTAASFFIYYFARGIPPAFFYANIFFMGVAAGYWAVFVTMAAEQFGTNVRATVATTVPNFIRGSTVPLIAAWQWLNPITGLARSALIVGAACILVSLFAVTRLEETYHKDLDYLEGEDVPVARPAPTVGGRRIADAGPPT